MERVCHFFDVPLHIFESQYGSARPLAMKFKQEHPTWSSLECWRQACQTMLARPESRRRYGELSYLSKIAVRYAGCEGLTTSGVEQNHAKQDKILTPDRSRLEITMENAEMKLSCDYDAQEEDAVIELAQSIWGELYGDCRLSACFEHRPAIEQAHQTTF